MSDYFVHSANVVPAGVRALAAHVNNIANEISSGLDKLPTEIQLKEGRTRYAVDTGVANVYVVTLPHVPTLTDGFNFIWKATNANTGSSTINVNGLGAKSIILASGGALISGDIINNQQLWCSYESVGDNFRLLSQSSSAGGGGGNAATIALLDESADATNFIPFANNATGNQALFTGTNLTFNAATGKLVATLLGGEIQTAAQPNITSLGELAALTISGDLTIGGTVDGIDIATDVAANTAKISYPDAAIVAASKVITDWIAVTQAVNLDTIETDAAASKVITDWIGVTQAVDLDTMESDIATNNAKATNANHTGDMAGSGALTAQPAIITGKTALTTGLAGTDELLVSDAGVLKRMDVSVMNAYFNANLNFSTSKLQTAIATTSGTAHTFGSIPSWVKKITIMFSGVSTNGSSRMILRIGDAGGIETSNYDSTVSEAANTYANGAYFPLNVSIAAGNAVHGIVTLALIDISAFTWALSVNLSKGSSPASVGGGSKSLSAALTQLELSTENGTDAFDAGSFNIVWE